MEQYSVTKIGVIRSDEKGIRIALEPQYAPALQGLHGFRHLQVVWWFSGCDNPEARGVLQEKSPYTKGPATLGTFATRSPMRPNPIAISCAEVIWLEEENAEIGIAYIDAEDGSPVLDIKPYTPSIDRVGEPGTPQWCAHWPASVERSGDFNWDEEFNF